MNKKLASAYVEVFRHFAKFARVDLTTKVVTHEKVPMKWMVEVMGKTSRKGCDFNEAECRTILRFIEVLL